MNLMYASNSSTIICCHVLKFIPRHSVLVAVIHDVVKIEKEEKDVLVVRMSTRGPVCCLKGSRGKDVSSNDHCMFSAL